MKTINEAFNEHWLSDRGFEQHPSDNSYIQGIKDFTAGAAHGREAERASIADQIDDALYLTPDFELAFSEVAKILKNLKGEQEKEA